MWKFIIDTAHSIGYQNILDVLLLTLLTAFTVAYFIIRYYNGLSDVKREKRIKAMENEWRQYMMENH